MLERPIKYEVWALSLLGYGFGNTRKSCLLNYLQVIHSSTQNAQTCISLVDTKEELSAFNPDIVKDQAAFANEAIQFLLNTHYASAKYRPKSVFIVGTYLMWIVFELNFICI